jgi:hypothetical protein
MALPLVLAIGDVGCEVAALLSLHDLCRMHVSSHGLQREAKVLVARSEAAQRKAICDLTPFPTKKALTDFIAKRPTWLNDFIPHVRVKFQRFESEHKTRLRDLHARIASLTNTSRKQQEKLRKAPAELEEKVAKLRRTEAEKRDQWRWRSPSSRPRGASRRARPSSHPCARCSGSGTSAIRSACERRRDRLRAPVRRARAACARWVDRSDRAGGS